MKWGKVALWAALALLILALAYGCVLRGHCWYAGWAMHRETTYRPFLGCLIEGPDGKRLPLSSLREVE